MKTKWLTGGILLTLTLLLLTFPASAYRDTEKSFDFEFKDMDLYRAAESIAKLMNRYVIFHTEVKNTAINLSLTDVSADFALRLLLESNGAYSHEKDGILYVAPIATRAPAAINPTIIPLVNVIAKDIEQNIKGYLGKDSTYTINEQKNAFIINGKDEEISKIRQLVQELDQEVSQIFIEAKIIETNTTYSRNLGIEWGNAQMRGNTSIISNKGINVSGFNEDSAKSFLGSLRVGLSKGSALDALITAGQKNGELKLISSPKITTLNGTPAIIDSDSKITLRGQTATSATGTTVTQDSLLQTLTSALKFRVTPYIISDDQVRLNIELTKSDPVDGDTESVTNVATNNLSTTMMVRNGQTASLGGIMSNLKRKGDAGVPFLAHIPILGWLFGSHNRETADRELLIFMTPTIYKGSKGVIQSRRANARQDEGTSSKEALQNLRAATPGNNSPEGANLTPLPGAIAAEPAKVETEKVPAPLMPAGQ
jgi:type IV pilus assembly protein PilQ